MTTIEKAYQELKKMPPHLQNEVINFISFVKSRKIPDAQVINDGSATTIPVFGCAKGKIKISDDFDEPLDIFADYMPESIK